MTAPDSYSLPVHNVHVPRPTGDDWKLSEQGRLPAVDYDAEKQPARIRGQNSLWRTYENDVR